MDTDKIEILLRAVETGSLAKTAEEFSYTPSALSRMVSSIEEEIGTKIVRRTYSGIKAEKNTEKIFKLLKKSVEIKKEIVHLAEQINIKDEITIATYASLSKYILPEITKKFHQKYQDIRINIIVADSLSDIIEKDMADIVIGERVFGEQYVWKEMISDPYVAVLPESTNLHDTMLHRDKKYDEIFIVPNDSKIKQFACPDNFRDIINVNSHDDSSVIEMIKAEMGISILPTLSVTGEESFVKTLPLSHSVERKLGITYKKEKEKNPLIIKIVKQLTMFQK